MFNVENLTDDAKRILKIVHDDPGLHTCRGLDLFDSKEDFHILVELEYKYKLMDSNYELTDDGKQVFDVLNKLGGNF